MYNKPFKITSPISNNIFSYEQRKGLGSQCSITVAELKKISIEKIQLGEDVVFEEIDEKGNLQSLVGIKYFVSTQRESKDTIIIDNHNHALYFWFKALQEKKIKYGATLIHIDQHADMGEPINLLDQNKTNDLKYIFEYTNSEVNIGNFILPAFKSGLIKDIIQVRSSLTLIETMQKISQDQYGNNIILDIDMDFWSISDDKEIKENFKIIRGCVSKVGVITIATSPYFIDQNFVISILKRELIDQESQK